MKEWVHVYLHVPHYGLWIISTLLVNGVFHKSLATDEDYDIIQIYNLRSMSKLSHSCQHKQHSDNFVSSRTLLQDS